MLYNNMLYNNSNIVMIKKIKYIRKILYLTIKADFWSTWVTITPVKTPRKISRFAFIH